MKLNGKCPKCHYQKIIQIKDTFHSNAAGNIYIKNGYLGNRFL